MLASQVQATVPGSKVGASDDWGVHESLLTEQAMVGLKPQSPIFDSDWDSVLPCDEPLTGAGFNYRESITFVLWMETLSLHLMCARPVTVIALPVPPVGPLMNSAIFIFNFIFICL